MVSESNCNRTLEQLEPFPKLILEVTCFLTCNFEKLILCFIFVFGKKTFGFVGIKLIVSLFLDTILLVTMFEFHV